MGTLADLLAQARDLVAQWREIRVSELGFWHRDAARLAIITFAVIPVLLLIIRAAFRRSAGRSGVALPALLQSFDQRTFSVTRHLPVLLLVLGAPFLLLALADPYRTLVRQTVSHPGRRISLLVDASSSMSTPFEAVALQSETAFRTTVAAAGRFIELRRQGKYRDLIALIEFGTRAYVITPFTNDYDNILLSTSLIGDPNEFAKFPDKGTMIGIAIAQSVELFRAFDFLDASGNLMVIFSDGEDERVTQDGRSVSDIVDDAVKAEIPIYLIRTNADKLFGDIIPDRIWKTAVERTGGKFFAAATEANILEAIREIDRAAEGTIELRQFAAHRPRFAPFAAIAFVLWSIASIMKLSIPWFRRFP